MARSLMTEADIPSPLMPLAVGQTDALPEWLTGLAIDVRCGERKLAQFHVIEHQKLASLTHSSSPCADSSECALAYPGEEPHTVRAAG
jgi:hypothetical protein